METMHNCVCHPSCLCPTLKDGGTYFADCGNIPLSDRYIEHV